jgi:transposase-like protein
MKPGAEGGSLYVPGAGHFECRLTLHTTAGEIKVRVPKLRSLPFESAIIERYRTRQISVEEAIVEMYLAGVSVRRVEDITEALWGTKVSAGTVSKLNQKVYGKIEEWRSRPIEGDHPYVFVDGIYLKRSWGGEVRNIAVLVAIGVNTEGFSEILGVAEGSREDKESWRNFFRYLKDRGLKGVRLIVSDKAGGAVEAINELYPDALWQRCMVHFYRNVFTKVPPKMIREVADMLKAIHAQESKDEARKKAASIVERLRAMKLSDAARIVETGIEETLSYYEFPPQHRVRIRTNNRLERLMKEIRRRTRVVGSFPDGQSALMLVAARLRYVASKTWGSRIYLNMSLLNELDSNRGTA